MVGAVHKAVEEDAVLEAEHVTDLVAHERAGTLQQGGVLRAETVTKESVVNIKKHVDARLTQDGRERSGRPRDSGESGTHKWCWLCYGVCVCVCVCVCV